MNTTMMNKERILKLADVIEDEEADNYGFRMNEWKGSDMDCGTSCCIAGHAVAMWDQETFNTLGNSFLVTDNWVSVGRNILGIDYDTAHALFVPGGVDYDYLHTRDRKLAAAVLRNLVHTGVVDWSGTERRMKECEA